MRIAYSGSMLPGIDEASEAADVPECGVGKESLASSEAGKHLAALERSFLDGTKIASRDEGVWAVRQIESIPPEQLRATAPLLEILYVMTLFELGEHEKCAERIAAMREYYERKDVSEDTRSRILGELEIVEGYMAFNDMRRMGEAFSRAFRLLKSGSVSVKSSSPVSFASPSLLFLYHAEYGCLDDIVVHFTDHEHIYRVLFNNVTAGMGDLLKGELAYSRDDFETAEQQTSRAVEVARHNAQESILTIALYLQMKIAIARGDRARAENMLEEIACETSRVHCQVLLVCADYCRAWLANALGCPERVPSWLLDGNFDRGFGLVHSVGVDHILCFESLFARGSYPRCSALIPVMRALFEGRNNKMGLLHVKLYEVLLAWVEGSREKRAEASAMLFEAWQMGRSDGLVMPFVEKSEALLPLFESVADEKQPKIASKADKDFAMWVCSMKARMTRHMRMLEALRGR